MTKAKPDNPAILDVYKKLSAGYEGLELKWFADLRTALRGYFFAAGGVGNGELEKAFQVQIDELGREIKALSAHPTAAETRKIDDHLYWLESARQTPELVQSVRAAVFAAELSPRSAAS